MSAETNVPSYWLNWRFFLCAIFVLTSLVLSSFLIWKHEGPRKRKKRGDDDRREGGTGVVYDDETWNTCAARIHPNWLLGFRVFGFVTLLGLISGNAIADGAGIFIFYTQWTFTLVTIYFGVAALVSIHRFRSGDNFQNGVSRVDEEQGSYRPPIHGEIPNVFKASNGHQRDNRSTRQVATTLGYIHQILFQTCAGAVLLTDGVFWFIIYPFLTSKDFNLDFFIVIMHSVNAVFLLGETFLNSLRFPLFRISYFVVWTGIFVLFQWIVHACVSFWWPYPFLDLSSPYAPLWYAAVGLMHVPCFGVFALIVKFKYMWLSKCFSEEP
ncbi:Transmembrane protein [Hirschfeldia incana]|nr:Transmembrane protein [Hirschfeldia incana]